MNGNGFAVTSGFETTGFPKLDDLRHPLLAVIFDVAIRESHPYMSYHTPSATLVDLISGDVPYLAWAPLETDTRRWDNLVWEYNLPPDADNIKAMYEQIRDQLNTQALSVNAFRVAVLKVPAGLFDYKIFVYIRP